MAGRTEDGRLVAIEPAIPCERCPLCLEGHPNLCPKIRFSGQGDDDGSMQEWMAWPERNLFPLPGGFTAADGAMLEPLGVAIHTVDLAHVRPGLSVGVFGAGPIGLFCLQVARAAGRRGSWPPISPAGPRGSRRRGPSAPKHSRPTTVARRRPS